MGRQETELFPEEERRVYSLISKSNGITAREIGRLTGIEKKAVSRLLVSSALMRELCYQDREYRWHAVVRQQAPWEGLYEAPSGSSLRKAKQNGSPAWRKAAHGSDGT